MLFLIDSLPMRVQKVQAAMGSLYDIRVFGNGGAALKALYELQPDAVLVDQRTMSKQGGGIHRTKCNDDKIKNIPFIIMSDVHEGEFLAGDGTGATDHFMKRPIPINLILDRIANSMSERVEKSWNKLPKSAGQALRTTAEQFNAIAKAVANNTPLDRAQVTASCNPLVACVSNNEHKHVLQGLRGHHNYTYVHSMRVAVFMSVFAQAYNVSKDEMTVLATGGYMHDVGKMVMSQALLNTSESLNGDDWDVIRDHVNHSGAIVGAIKDVNPTIRVIAEQHHERLDGSGYPAGISGLQVNELGRMAAIADVFAGLTDDRPYKVAMDANTALGEMQTMSGALDPHLFKLFREAISS